MFFLTHVCINPERGMTILAYITDAKLLMKKTGNIC